MAKVLVGVIRIYQRFLSPVLATLFGSSCLYVPTCSHYAVGAIRKHGALRGTGYALWRILRCNPFSQGGFDPVP